MCRCFASCFGLRTDNECLVCHHTALLLMHEPVVAADGHTYERKAIERLIECTQKKGGEICSPLTGAALPHLMLTPNHSMRSMIIKALEDSSTLSSL